MLRPASKPSSKLAPPTQDQAAEEQNLKTSALEAGRSKP
jgi:hypothetical protein